MACRSMMRQKRQKKTNMILSGLIFFLIIVPILLVLGLIQQVILWLRLPQWNVIPMLAHKLLCKYLGIKVNVVGEIAKGKPTLLVSNHISWMDIPAIGAVLPISFVAKAEVGRWPIVRTLAKMQKTIFVDRTRKTDTGRVATEMGARMNEGRGVVLFAEGTSDIGSHVLPFRSALVGATQMAMKSAGGGEIYIQPMCIAYTKLNGLPISRAERTKIAWVGDMGLTDNLSDILLSGTKSVTIMLGEPMLIDAEMNRKAITQKAHAQVRAMLVALNRGLPLPQVHQG